MVVLEWRWEGIVGAAARDVGCNGWVAFKCRWTFKSGAVNVMVYPTHPLFKALEV